MENSAEVIARLEQEWDLETGFLGLLREGAFDAQKLNRLLDTLRGISYRDDDTIYRRIVSLLWSIPLFME